MMINEWQHLADEIERLQQQLLAALQERDDALVRADELKRHERTHIENLERLRARNDELKHQVNRLLAKESERIGDQLRRGR
jgi:hypothetical protein